MATQMEPETIELMTDHAFQQEQRDESEDFQVEEARHDDDDDYDYDDDDGDSSELSYMDTLLSTNRLIVQDSAHQYWVSSPAQQDSSSDIIFEALQGRYFWSSLEAVDSRIWVLGDDPVDWTLRVLGKYNRTQITVTDVRYSSPKPAETEFDLIIIQNPERWVHNVEEILTMTLDSLKMGGSIEVQGLGNISFPDGGPIVTAWQAIRQRSGELLGRDTSLECSTWYSQIYRSLHQVDSHVAPVTIARSHAFVGLLDTVPMESPRRQWLYAVLEQSSCPQTSSLIDKAQHVLAERYLDGSIDFYVCAGRKSVQLAGHRIERLRPDQLILTSRQGRWICRCCAKAPYEAPDEKTLRKHESLKPFHCTGCTSRFKKQSEARRHLGSTHQRANEWSCKNLQSWHDTVHERSHCGYCGQAETSEIHVIESHHFGVCNDKTFFRSDHFLQHIRSCHKGVKGPWNKQVTSAAYHKRTR